MARPTVTARTILDLLEAKHHKDVFVAECKNGPTHFTDHLRLDAWVMTRSWANPRSIGYEIKVSRSDFTGDTKWRAYLPYCTEFYFVCPSGLIQPEELGDNVGLLWTSKTGTRLFIKRKAPVRDVEVPESLYRYILMCRTQVTRGEVYRDRHDRAGAWREWLRRRVEYKNLGYQVGKRVREYVHKVNGENEKLRTQMQEYDAIRSRLEELGFDPDARVSSWSVDSRLKEVLTGIPKDLEWVLKRVRDDAVEALERIDAFRKLAEPRENDP